VKGLNGSAARLLRSILMATAFTTKPEGTAGAISMSHEEQVVKSLTNRRVLAIPRRLHMLWRQVEELGLADTGYDMEGHRAIANGTHSIMGVCFWSQETSGIMGHWSHLRHAHGRSASEGGSRPLAASSWRSNSFVKHFESAPSTWMPFAD